MAPDPTFILFANVEIPDTSKLPFKSEFPFTTNPSETKLPVTFTPVVSVANLTVPFLSLN